MAGQIRTAIDSQRLRASRWSRACRRPDPPTVDMYPGDVARGTEAAAFGHRRRVPVHGPGPGADNDADANRICC